MEKITYKISLDVNRNGIQRTIQGIETGDRYLREIRITLRNGNELVELPTDDSIGISMYVTKPNSSSPSINACSRDGNEIVYTIQPSDVTTMGTVIMQMKVVASSIKGASGTLISPRFALEVWESDVVDSSATSTTTYTALDQALAQARAYNNSHITGVVVDDAYLIKVTFADGTVYTSTALQTISTKITALDTKVEGYGALIATKADKTTVNALATTVASKADTSTVNALASRVTTAELNITSLGSTKADKSTVESLASTVATKADSSTVTALSGRVTTAESNITSLGTTKADKTELATKADASTVSALATTVATKADASTVTTLSGRVTTAESNISTNTTNIATNASSISTLSTTKADKTEVATKADKTALAETQRSLDTLWKLNKGISYDFETDSTSAYSKAIPSGAKSADLQMIGGLSMKSKNLSPIESWTNKATDTRTNYNLQVNLSQTIGAQSKLVVNDIISSLGRTSYTFTSDDNYVGCVVKHNGSAQDLRFNIEVPFKSGVTYTLSFDVNGHNPTTVGGINLSRIQIEEGDSASDYYPYFSGYINLWDEQTQLGLYDAEGNWVTRNDVLSSKNPIYVKSSTTYHFTTPDKIFVTEWKSDGTFIDRVAVDSSASYSFTTNSNCAYIHFNLLASYGTTYKNDIAINVGTSGAYSPYGFDGIINADVTNVETVGKNIWDEEWELGKYGSDGSKTSSTNNIRCKNRIPIKPNATYSRIVESYNTYLNTQILDADGNVIDTNAKRELLTTPSNARYITFYVPIAYGNVYKNDIAIIETTDASASYVPYNKEASKTIPIPTSIRNLDGYGWGIGNVYNEVDFVGKTYSNMKSVDLGTLDWTVRNSSSSPTYYLANIADLYQPNGSNTFTSFIPNLFAKGYSVIPQKDMYEKNGACVTNTMTSYVLNGNSVITIRNDAFNNDASAFKSAMSGVILHYEATEGGEDYNAKLYTKRIAKIKFDGTESYWEKNATQPYYRVGNSQIGIKASTSVICNLFPNAPLSDADECVSCGSNYLQFKKTSITSLADWKTWLTKNDLILYYELETPLVTEITDSIDSFIVEGNGTITFKQTDSTLPIPNKEEYLIALNEVTE